jgi:amino acid transporter/nucleotide-binding universal stress UspA family protein
MSGDTGFESYDEQTDLARDLSLFDITMIGVGAMIGAGIFVLTAIAAGQAGPGLIMAFAFNGVVTILTGMVYAELGSAIPEAGGGYLWVKDALGRSQAFLAGWMSWFAHAVAGSVYALGFGSFVTLLLVEYFSVRPFGLATTTLDKIFAAFAGILFTYINFRGAEETGIAANIVALIKLTVIIVFVIFGIGQLFGQPADLTVSKFKPFLPNGFGGVFIAMGITFIAFEGYEIIVQAGEEVKDPQETLPKSIFYAMAAVVTIYMLVALVLIGTVEVTPTLLQAAEEATGGHTTGLPPISTIENPANWQVLGRLGELGLAIAAEQIIPYGTLIILVAGIFSTLSALNATTYSSTRVSFAMGRDRVLPDFFRKIHSEKRTPYLATVFSGVLIVGMAVTLPIETVAVAADVMFMLLFLQVNYAAIVIRREYGDQLDYGYIMPYFPYVPIAGILTKLVLAGFLYQYSPLAWYYAIAWIIVGVGVFFIYSNRRISAEERAAETRLITEERASTDRSYQVLVPIANPDHAERLTQLGSAIARHNDGEVLLTSVATVPEQTPLDEGRAYIEDERELLDEAMEYVPEDVPAHRTVTIGHRIGRSIQNIAYQRDSDMILLGWRGRRKNISDYVLGSHIDEVVSNAPCDVTVAKVEGTDQPERLLVPTAEGPHSALAEDVASAFVETGANATLLHIATTDRDASEAFVTTRQEALADGGIDVSTAVIESDDIEQAILTYADENDFETVVIGAAEESLLQRVLFGEIPETIGEQFGGQVMMVKQHRLVQSAVNRFVQQWVGKVMQALDRSD